MISQLAADQFLSDIQYSYNKKIWLRAATLISVYPAYKNNGKK